MESSMAMAAVLATEVHQLRSKIASLAEARSARRLRLSRKLSSLDHCLCIIQLACKDAEKQPADDNWMEQLRTAILETDHLLEMINLRQLPRTTTEASVVAQGWCDFLLATPMGLHFAAGRRLRRMAEVFDAIGRKARSSLDHAHAAPPATCYGRTREKEEIIRLMEDRHFRVVIQIVGMTGSGKSTLARWAYHDKSLRQRFDLRVIVGRNHSTGATLSGGNLPLAELRDATRLVQKERSLSPSEEDRFEVAVEEIWQSQAHHNCLVVLLDVNNVVRRDLFERLMKALQEGNWHQRNAVIITTSNNADLTSLVAGVWHTLIYCHLNPLSKVESQQLLREHLPYPMLTNETEYIMEECGRMHGGHPLSVVIMANMIRYKAKRHYLLTGIRGRLPRLCADLKEMYENLIDDDDDAHSSSSSLLTTSEKLQKCFEFLSLFPDDCSFYREELTDLWAAQGFISLDEDEDEADDYFEVLMRAGALVLCDPQTQHDDPEISRPGGLAYKTRRLLAFFAQHVSSSSSSNSKDVHLALSPHSIYFAAKYYLRYLPPNCKHLSFVHDNSESSDYFSMDKLFGESRWLLRTLMLLGPPSSNARRLVCDVDGNYKNFKIFELLRVLHLREVRVPNLLHGVVEHSHLIYLNISQSDTETLPDSIGDLRNLKMLKLLGCKKLRRLPKSIDRLLRLEKLDLEGCIFLEELPESMASVMKNLKLLNTLHCPLLTRMPPSTGQLSSLQSLSRYTASDELGRSITELRHLTTLEGRLRLDNLDKLADPRVAGLAKLEEKEKLRALTLCWDWPDVDAEADHSGETEQQVGEKPNFDVEAAEQVIEALRPNRHLEFLKLISCTAKHFPSWMTVEPPYLTSLLHIRLFNLKRCESLPALGQLPLLKVVEMSGMDNVAELDDSFYGRTGTFHSLERLTLYQMPNLKRWIIPEREEEVFPNLTHLTFIQCPKLEVPNRSLPSVTALTMWLNNQMLYRSKFGLNYMAPNVKKLSVSLCQDVQSSSTTCQGLWGGLTSLEKLEISACDNLTCLPKGILEHLQSLKIIGCRNMESLPEWLTDLDRLSISACPKLRWIPESLKERSSFLKIRVEGCPLLKYAGNISDSSEWGHSD